ncbi:MAG: hypothetical protein ACYCW6_04480 [Candidatus Xenobia bacterium]
MTELVEFLRRLEKLGRPGLVLSRSVGPPLMLAATREAVPQLTPSLIDASGGRRALTRNMQSAVFGILICRGEPHPDLMPALEHLLEEGVVLEDEQGQWQPVRPHEGWRLVTVVDSTEFSLTDRFPYKLHV